MSSSDQAIQQDAQAQVDAYLPDVQTQINLMGAKIDQLLRTHLHDGNNAPLIRLSTDITGLFQQVTSAPTAAPQNMFQQIKIYETGGVHRLYWYDPTAKAWRYVVGT